MRQLMLVIHEHQPSLSAVDRIERIESKTRRSGAIGRFMNGTSLVLLPLLQAPPDIPDYL
jgi:hypothetical protein